MTGITNINEAYSWNLTRIAEAFDLHRDTVRKRLREAGIKPVGKKSGYPVYRLGEAAPVLFSNENTHGNAGAYKVEDLGPKDKKEHYQSENERLKFQTATGDLIPRAQHREDLAQTLKAVVAYFESLPDKMERRRVFSPEQLIELERATDDFRAQLHDMLINFGDDNG